jgi:hypothetical protein
MFRIFIFKLLTGNTFAQWVQPGECYQGKQITMTFVDEKPAYGLGRSSDMGGSDSFCCVGLQECVTKCHRRSGCTGITYKGATCTLYSYASYSACCYSNAACGRWPYSGSCHSTQMTCDGLNGDWLTCCAAQSCYQEASCLVRHHHHQILLHHHLLQSLLTSRCTLLLEKCHTNTN